jgi:hypothetical protein
MQLTAFGLAAALALTSTAAFAMRGGGGAGVSGSTYTKNPAECGGLVCFLKSRSNLAAPHPRRKRAMPPRQADRARE